MQSVIKLVGGAENINKVWHCMTRLRFDLVDENKVAWEEIKNLPGVLGAQSQSDQVQIIIGPKVNVWYEAIVSQLEPVAGATGNVSTKGRKSLVSLFMDTVSGVFGPIVPAIAGAGMIKGLLAGLIALKIISGKSETVMIIDLIASGVFYFLPFFLAVSAARIFKTNEYLAAAVAACLMYPTLIDSAKALASHTAGAPTALCFMDVLKTVFTPTLTLFIASLVSLTAIGPAGIYLGKLLAFGIQGLFDVSAVFAGFIVGAIRSVAILTAIHHAMTPRSEERRVGK